MKKYQQLAQQLTEQIALGVWLPGDRLPSLREQVISSGMSFMTVSHAYQLLESQGRIVARPQSGYYVAPQPVKLRQPAPPAQVTRDEAVDINTYIFEVLQASRQASMLPFASAFPDPRLFPLQQLNRSLAQVSKTATAMSVIENLPPGNAELRHAIARRYALQGMNVSPDEIVITAGALEAALQNYPVKACWLMTNGQNPLGFTLSAEKKAALMALLARYNVMLIEDDVYSELYFGREKPLPAKFWDRQEMTLHCSSFSKCLVPGFRIGWVAAGKQARRIQQLQLMSTLSTSSPMQLALVDYLSTKRYDAHLRRLRRQLAERKQQAWQALLRHLPPEVVVHHSDSGYFLWIELPEGADASALSARALASHISIAPGKMFSTSDSWTSFFRFNTAWGWGEREEQGVKRLGELIREQLA
ncbi:PLP-dependent aminotransferase family protein [Klebsiella pneumoniae]|uniref:aminotransferase-like domain-containing protein n=1 Tax=Klebsiella pneumoniae TaxID=573 RepID=UPI0010337749|nr:PLP-dependent aminotransferase family protein [Klebsiella pneumoniae]WKI00836.1 PLP-dependent aminotransferase family protein [Klebsiella pneumoniae]HEE1074244.1 PLP-dependent aminotransferase family protein [Klebsiella pneumoniae]